MFEELKHGSKVLVGKAVLNQNTILYVLGNNSRTAWTTNILSFKSLPNFNILLYDFNYFKFK